jgi:hypothetical protein
MSIRIGSAGTVRLNNGVKFRVYTTKVIDLPGFSGNRWYVSSTYNGSVSNGSIDTPWKSLSDVRAAIANTTIKSGDAVYFKRGDTFTGAFNLELISGTYDKRYIFTAYGTGNKPKFVGNLTGVMNQLFYLRGCSYLTFDNLEIIDTTIDPNDRSVTSRIQYAFKTEYYQSTSTTNIIIQNCDVSLVGIAAVFNVNCPSNTFASCNVSNLRMVRNTNDGPPPGLNNDFGANGLTVASSNNTIVGNTFTGCWAESFDYGYDGGGIEFFEDVGGIIENNLVAYNTFYDNNGTFEFGSDASGIIRNNVIAYNKIINNGGLFYINNGGAFAVTVSNLQFYNNVVLQTVANRSGRVTTMMNMRTSENRANIITSKNNIFFATQANTRVGKSATFDTTNLIASNNVYTLQNGSTINFYTGPTDFVSNGAYTPYWTNTSDANPINWNFSPLAASILINNGTNVSQTKDFAGNPVGAIPEIGILEYL